MRMQTRSTSVQQQAAAYEAQLVRLEEIGRGLPITYGPQVAVVPGCWLLLRNERLQQPEEFSFDLEIC